MSCALVVLMTIAGCGPVPCTSCLKVSGTFTESTQGSTVDCADLRELLFLGKPGAVTIAQSGSNLSIVDGIAPVSGVLYQDRSATFGPIPATAEPVDQMGNPDPSGDPEPGKLYLTGFFSGSGGVAQSFQGTYVFIADVDGCEADAKAQWSR